MLISASLFSNETKLNCSNSLSKNSLVLESRTRKGWQRALIRKEISDPNLVICIESYLKQKETSPLIGHILIEGSKLD